MSDDVPCINCHGRGTYGDGMWNEGCTVCGRALLDTERLGAIRARPRYFEEGGEDTVVHLVDEVLFLRGRLAQYEEVTP